MKFKLLSNHLINMFKTSPHCSLHITSSLSQERCAHIQCIFFSIAHTLQQCRILGTVQPSCLAISPEDSAVPLGSSLKNAGGCSSAHCSSSLACYLLILSCTSTINVDFVDYTDDCFSPNTSTFPRSCFY